MIFEETGLHGSFLVWMEPRNDERGWFSRFFCMEEFSQIGHSEEWVQMNHSYTREAGTIRGIHFQQEPFSEIKLVKCIAGKVFDVIVDLRKGSATYKRYFGIELSPSGPQMIYIPKGFAHGFQTLTDNVELIYFHSNPYTPAAEGGIRFDDPAIGINWPLEPGNISERDLRHPRFHD
jgi:dTDP-4-dehydrorhamnose 3,5-epimerase